MNRWGQAIFEGAIDTFAHSKRSFDSLRGLLPVFDPWFAFTWIPDRQDELVTVPSGWPTTAIGVTWLDAELGSIDDAEALFVRKATESPYSALLIESLVPGWTLTVRDMMTGRRFRIVDPELARWAQPDDMLLSAVLTLDGRSFLLGAASDALPCDWRFELREARLCYTGDPWLPRSFWMGFEWEIFDSYREACEQHPLSVLHTEGAVRDPRHLRWQVSASFATVLDRLRPLTACYGDEWALDEENGPDGEPHMLLTWYERGPSGGAYDWQSIGYLYLDEQRLAGDVPTLALADRLVAEVAVRAGDVTTLIETRRCAARRVHDRRSMLLPAEVFGPAPSIGSLSIH